MPVTPPSNGLPPGIFGTTPVKGKGPATNPKTTKTTQQPKTAPKAQPFVLLQQPAFDPRIRKLAQPFGTGTTPLQRGHMSWDPNTPWPQPYGNGNGAGGQTWDAAPKILFLFNPSTVAASYEISDATAQSALIYPVSSVQPQLRVPLQQQISFTIMFDRTYEMFSAATNPNTGPTKGTADLHSEAMQDWGVELDILAVKQFTGMFTDVYQGNNPIASSDGSSSADAPNVNHPFDPLGVNQGVMQLSLAYVYFGTPASGLRYYGYIDSWDVQYTHFTQQMVPMRCVVDISFTLLPPPVPAGPDAGAATAAGQSDDPITGLPIQSIIPVTGKPLPAPLPPPNK